MHNNSRVDGGIPVTDVTYSGDRSDSDGIRSPKTAEEARNMAWAAIEGSAEALSVYLHSQGVHRVQACEVVLALVRQDKQGVEFLEAFRHQAFTSADFEGELADLMHTVSRNERDAIARFLAASTFGASFALVGIPVGEFRGTALEAAVQEPVPPGSVPVMVVLGGLPILARWSPVGLQPALGQA